MIHPLLLAITAFVVAFLWAFGVFDGVSWVNVAHRTVQFVLVVSVVVIAVRCADALEGGGTRVGSPSVGVRAGHSGVAVQVHSTAIDPDHVPSSRLLNGRGLTVLGNSRPAALTQASFEIPVQHPQGSAIALILLAGIASLTPWFMGLLAVERILRRARNGEPFAGRNIRDLRWLAFAVSGAVYLGIFMDYYAASAMLDSHGVGLMLGYYEQQIEPRLIIPFAPLATGALVLALAEVWKQAITLWEDAEATI